MGRRFKKELLVVIPGAPRAVSLLYGPEFEVFCPGTSARGTDASMQQSSDWPGRYNSLGVTVRAPVTQTEYNIPIYIYIYVCARIFSICTVIHFQTYRRGDLGTEPTPEHMWSSDEQ